MDNSVYFFLVDLNEETTNYSFNLVRMNSDSDELDRFNIYPGELLNVKQPEIVMDDGGNLRLFWIASEGLYTMLIGEDGALIGEPVLLSGSDAVSSYDVAHSLDGKITLWYAGSRRIPGIYVLSQFDGSAQGVLVDPDGTLVRLRYDENGRLHTAWAHYPFGFEKSEIVYGVYDPGSEEFSMDFTPIFPLDIGTTVSLDDLALGVDDTNVYISWVTNVHTGPLAGDIRANYITFPIGTSLPTTSQPVYTPTIYSLEFEDSANDLKAGRRVLLQGLNVPMTIKIQDFRTNVMPTGEVVLAVRSPAEHLWRKTREQVNLVYFDRGSLFAYQPLTFTYTISTFPNVMIDQDGYVSLTWLEKESSSQHSVYFASTQPQMIDRFHTVSYNETLTIIYTVLFGMLIGALLAPIAAGVWLLAPVFVLGLFSFVSRMFPPKLKGFLSTVGVAVAVMTVWYIKLAIFPLMTEYVPFSAWVPNIPMILGNILRVAVPLLTLT
ncbi:MAG TPA: hypothetical protein VK994_06125, partial [Bacteroidales bacterium]|nr:hypothetical protein [Bacteroidales bacterium]